MLRKRSSNAGLESTLFGAFHAQSFLTTLTLWCMSKMSTTTDLFAKTEKSFLFKSKLSSSPKWTRIYLFMMSRTGLTSTLQARRTAKTILRKSLQILAETMTKTSTSHGHQTDQPIKTVAPFNQLPVQMMTTLAIIKLKLLFQKMVTPMCRWMTL